MEIESSKEPLNYSSTYSPSKLRLDADNLDEECIIQPELIELFGEQHAITQDRVDALKKGLSLLQANLDKSIRQKASAEGVKVTEPAIEKEVLRSPVYIEEQKRLRAAELQMAKASATYYAIRARGNSLDNLVKLFTAGYFSQLATSGQREMRANAIETRLASIMSDSTIEGRRLKKVDD